jgi:mannonate dehydratase
MTSDLSRRKIMQAIGVTALSTQAAPGAQIAERGAEMTPKICLESGAGSLSAGHLDAAGLRRVKQLGVDHVLMGGPKIPWEESQIRATMDTLNSG